MEDFWCRLKNLIKAENTTQEWVANEADISFGTFRKWMSRKTMPNADQAVRIAILLNTSVEYLVTGNKVEQWQPPARYADIIRNFDLLSDDGIEDIRVLVNSKIDRLKREGNVG